MPLILIIASLERGLLSKKVGGLLTRPEPRVVRGSPIPLIKRQSDKAAEYATHIEKKHNKARAMSLLAMKLGRGVYYMLRQPSWPYEVETPPDRCRLIRKATGWDGRAHDRCLKQHAFFAGLTSSKKPSVTSDLTSPANHCHVRES